MIQCTLLGNASPPACSILFVLCWHDCPLFSGGLLRLIAAAAQLPSALISLVTLQGKNKDINCVAR